MVTIRGRSDNSLEAVADSLARYQQRHPNARIEVYRQNAASVRARVIDPDFQGVSKSDRHDVVWDYVKDLPEDQQSEISVLLLLTPDEVEKSFANEEFDHPVPSRL